MEPLEQPLEYCALRFLIQWKQREKLLYEYISNNPTLEQLRSALSYFQVARSFKGLGRDDVAQEVLDSLLQVDSNFSSEHEKKVIDLAKSFNQFNLSAASKLFWLKYRSPYIIYDSRAIRALRRLGCSFKNANYSQYCSCWREQYSERQKMIVKAVSRLHEIREFLPLCHGSVEEVTTLTSKSWFIERVFDTFLWEMGAKD